MAGDLRERVEALATHWERAPLNLDARTLDECARMLRAALAAPEAPGERERELLAEVCADTDDVWPCPACGNGRGGHAALEDEGRISQCSLLTARRFLASPADRKES